MTDVTIEIISLAIAALTAFAGCLLWLAKIREHTAKNYDRILRGREQLEEISSTFGAKIREHSEIIAAVEKVVRTLEYRVNGIEQYLKTESNYHPVDVTSYLDDEVHKYSSHDCSTDN